MATRSQHPRQFLFVVATLAALPLVTPVGEATVAIPAGERQALIDLHNATGGSTSWYLNNKYAAVIHTLTCDPNFIPGHLVR